MTADLGDTVRKYRRMAGLSQEQLADEAELSTGTIKKLEQGGSVRIETLHTIARALGIRTSQLLAEDPLQPQRSGSISDVNIRTLRIALTPRVRLAENSAAEGEEPDIRLLGRAVSDAVTLYPAGRYESLAAVLPSLVQDANSAVAYYAERNEDQRKALLTRSEVLALAGRFLTQLRQFDIAHVAATAAILDAKAAGDDVATANRVRALCFTLLRTGRFDEAEELAVEGMELVEPKTLIPTTDIDRYSVWGGVAMEAAAAAIRNNRPREAVEYRRVASIAAAAIGQANEYDILAIFGPVTAAMKSVEDAMILGDARTVMRKSTQEEALSPNSWRRLGKPSKTDGSRHILDLARAYARTGDTTSAVDELARLYRAVPEWLRNQNAAIDIWQEIAAKRKRSLPAEMREVGRHLGIIG